VAEHAAVVPLYYGRKRVMRRPWVEGVWKNALARSRFDQVLVQARETAS
jgi:hypothetical protein